MKYGSFKIFSMLFGIAYFICFYKDWSLFRYYPETGAFSLAPRLEDGPAILWYGWLAIAALVSGAAAVIVPRRLADRLSSGLLWIIPFATVAVVLYNEKRWFVQ